jgi:DNA-binding ferritin-like protein
MNTEQALLTTFCSNFVAYYKTHASHANVTGRNFFSDHELLGKIYLDLQTEIDTLGELLRTIDVEMPNTLADIIADSEVSDSAVNDNGDGEEFLIAAQEDLEKLIDIHLDLEETTKDLLEFNHLANYAQDRVKTLHKYLWMVKSTLKGREDD